ncbi:MAG: beta-xylosidase [Eubacterium sp.]|jgi:arabinan endo-1,5-alpha-L-arabinosidase|nr:beta-xylosidase [Eubacterium sp.]
MLNITACGGEDMSVVYPKEPPRETLYDHSVTSDETKWGNLNFHDPSIIKDGEWYYTVTTDVKVGGTPKGGIPIRKSKDLINWEWVGRVFSKVPEDARKWTRARTLWAPDVTKIGDTFYLYYAASRFGTNQSFIGLATSKSMEGPWENRGEVIKSTSSSLWNAIDPNLIFDADGNFYMAFGSFFGGIFMVELDKTTGKLKDGSKPAMIATRSNSVATAIEGPYIIYNPDLKKYYLFVSYDSLSKDYNVRVGRSDKITGPYVDYNGNEMTNTELPPNDVGTKILGGYRFGDKNGWVMPGHNSVLKDGNDYLIVHHARGDKDTNWPYLHVRKILWSEDGWPMVSPERYTGEKEQKLSGKLLEGKWETIVLDKNNNEQLSSKTITLKSGGKIDDGSGKSKWEFKDDNTIIMKIYDPEKKSGAEYIEQTAKVIPAWDWENWKTTLVFTGMNKSGVSVWGKKNE